MRLIDADELKKSYENLNKTAIEFEIAPKGIIDLIDNAPTVDIPNYGGQIVPDTLQGWRYEERPQGEWITHEGYDGDEYYECSVCKDAFILMEGTPKENNYNFCPNCGADMRGGAKNETD